MQQAIILTYKRNVGYQPQCYTIKLVGYLLCDKTYKSHNLSNGREPGDKNMKAILEFFETTAGEFKISLITTREVISSSMYSLACLMLMKCIS